MQRQLTKLDQEISVLSGRVGKSIKNYDIALHKRIKELVRQRSTANRGVGVLEEIKALHRLSDRDSVVNAAQWLLRLLLVTVECWPVLTKLLGGTSNYDTLVGARFRAAVKLHEHDLEVRVGRQIGRLEVEAAREKERKEAALEAVRGDERARRQDTDRRQQEDEASQRADLQHKIDEHAARLRASL